jgi:hypothetical protein
MNKHWARSGVKVVKHGGADGIFPLFSLFNLFMMGLGSSMWASFHYGYSTIESGCDESLIVLALNAAVIVFT